MIRPLALVALLAALPAAAQEPEAFSLRDYPARMAEAVAACESEPEGAACRIALRSVLPSTVEALSFLGYESTYAESAPLLREMAAFPKGEIQAAAIYALARLGPAAEDLPVLREALLSDVPGVRRAATGALKLVPDAAAQELAGRAQPMPSGSAFDPDPLPFDPAAMGIATWPAGTRFLHFQRMRNNGAYVFIAAPPVAELLAAFEAQANAKAVGMGEIEARFGADYGELLKPWAERNASLGAVGAVVLTEADAASGSPAIVAFVYEDYALAATGFAIQRLPGEPLPLPDRPAEPPPPAPTGDAAIWYGGGAFVPKEGAASDDIAAWRAVEDAGGEGAAAYLEAFPDGAWRGEAEALLAAPALETDFDVYAETDTIKVTWRGVTPGGYLELRVAPASDGDAGASVARSAPEVASAEGAADLELYPFIEPGVYEVRLVGEGREPVAVAEFRIALAAARLTLERDSFKPGEEIRIAFAAMAGTPGDVISIAPKGADPGDYGRIYQPSGGAAEGSLTLKAPDEPGDYEVRAWFNGERRMRARIAFTVRGPDLPPEIDGAAGPALALAAASAVANEKIAVRFAGFPGDGGDYVYLAPAGAPESAYVVYADTGRESAGLVELKLPPEPGAYEVRAVIGSKVAAAVPLSIAAPPDAAMATLTLEKTSFAPGETIAIAFSGMSGSEVDYVAVAAAGSRYGQYVSYAYTKGETAGRAELKAPGAPGAYEIRAFFNEDESVLRGAVAIVVEAAP
ncbi:MAG: HEAT repeat domain-containing protein [Alphaproteobacteria bacterium]|nr:HEAT repeat domain-containing protein [Alphaproteobacteria bacterium]